MTLPADLLSAETEAVAALQAALAAEAKGRWTMDLRFEGLRLQPVALRLQVALHSEARACQLLFADAGATALAKRDAPDVAEYCHSISDWCRRQGSAASPAEDLLLLVALGPPDYEVVEQLCGQHGGAVVLLNSRLEDAAVGIGSVARERRKGFLAPWQSAYTLQPLTAAALRHAYPDRWQLYRLDPDGYRAVGSFEKRPAPEELDEALTDGFGQGLRSVDRFMKDLSS